MEERQQIRKCMICRIEGQEYFCVSVQGGVRRVDPSSVLALKQSLRDVDIFISEKMGGKIRKALVETRGKLQDYYKTLSGCGENFYLCHSYCAVNFNRVRMIDTNEKKVVFDDNRAIEMGANSIAKTKKAYIKYMSRRCGK